MPDASPVTAPPESVGGAEIVGRGLEQSRIETWMEQVSAGTRALVLRGDSGIGKTTLWRHGLERWRRLGRTVLSARPAEEELSLALSGIVDLFEDVAVDVDRLRTNDDPVSRGRSVLDALRAASSTGPILMAIDDLQWLDAASARTLRYAIRRLDDEPIGILATVRTDFTPSDPLAMSRLLTPGRHDTLDVGPLDLAALRRLVGSVVDTISPRTLRRIEETSGGNPMFALELARNLAETGPSSRLRLPTSLEEAILVRLGAVPEELSPLLETVSALARTTAGELREVLPRLDVDRLLILAETHGLLTVGDDLEVRFAHPLVGSVVYGRIHPTERRKLHARLAETATDPDLEAYHLALSTDDPDAAVSGQLAHAAGRASDRGAFGLAAEFAEHAVRLTPPGDVHALRRHALAHVRHVAAAGDMGRALELADALVAQLPPGAGRAEALVQRAQLEDEDLETGEALLVLALDDAGEDAPLRGRVLDQLGWLRGIFRGDLAAGIACGREALAIAQRVGDKEFEMSATAGLSNLETLAGNPRPDLMARAVELEEDVGRPPLWAGPKVLLAEQLLWAGDLERARTILEEAVAHAERSNHERWKPYSLYDLAAVESAAGNLARADALLATAIEVARDCEDDHVESWIFYRQALVATWLGRAQVAREAAQKRVDVATRRGERPGLARARSVLGLLALSEGDTAIAVSELTQSVQLLDEMGFRHPGAIPALPDAVEALAVAGELDHAEILLERLREQVRAIGSAWASVALERAAGTLSLARGDDEAVPVLEKAASGFFDLGFRPDGARALLLEGRALIRSGRRTAAADVLAGACATFAKMGARLWEGRARVELERAAPGRSSGELTPTERRVTALVAEGSRNREIAETLFMSLATVEAHLTRIYRKLQIRSRSELTRLVVEGTIETDG
jgi:DNA-binding CsgD family transcriptional regulator